MDRFDVIIIGTGAGGGTLAQPRQVNVEGRYQTKEVWHDATASRSIRTPTKAPG